MHLLKLLFFRVKKLIIVVTSSILLCTKKKVIACVLYAFAGPRITVPRALRWGACGAVTVSSSTALLVRLFSPECEPQNIETYDKGK